MDDNLVKLRGKRLTDLYKYSPDEIFDFLRDVSKDPEEFNIDVALKEQLQDICSQILSLCGPTEKNKEIGKNYADSAKKGNKAITPDQHIYRLRTLEEKTKPEGWSKFNINYDSKWNHNGPHFWPVKDQPSVRVKTQYWSHYDLLGLFLSLMGPAQPGATKLTFFVPLTAVYARWCFVIGGKGTIKLGDPKKNVAVGSGFGPSPMIHQCTWRESKGAAGGYEFFIGASLAGDNSTDAAVLGSWGRRLRIGRFDLLNNFNNISTQTWDSKEVDPNNPDLKKQVTWGYDNSPGITEGGTMQNHFGNCGETYPFLQMFDQWSVGIRDKINGLSLSKRFLTDEVMYENLRVDKLTEGQWIDWGPPENRQRLFDIGHLWQPCINCRYLLKVAGVINQVNFEPITDILTERPPDPNAPGNETN